MVDLFNTVADWALSSAATVIGEKGVEYALNNFLSIFNGKAEIDVDKYRKEPFFERLKDAAQEMKSRASAEDAPKLEFESIDGGSRFWRLENSKSLSEVELFNLHKALERITQSRNLVQLDGNRAQSFLNDGVLTVIAENQISVSSSGENSPAIGINLGTINIGSDNRLKSDVRVADLLILEREDVHGTPWPEVKATLRNIGTAVAFLKEVRVVLHGSVEIVDCNLPRYSLMQPTAFYDLNILRDKNFKLSHSIPANDLEQIVLRFGRDEGGPEMTIYKLSLDFVLNEDEELLRTKEFHVKMYGPSIPMGSFTAPRPEKEWMNCMMRNIQECKKIGYDYVPHIHPNTLKIMRKYFEV